MTVPQIFQAAAGLSLLIAIIVILRHVHKTTISDKYGVMGSGFLTILLYINISHNWFAMMTLGSCVLALTAAIGFMALGISFSAQLTEYSRVRRKAIQELALLRHQYEAALRKMETSDMSQTAQSC